MALSPYVRVLLRQPTICVLRTLYSSIIDLKNERGEAMIDILAPLDD